MSSINLLGKSFKQHPTKRKTDMTPILFFSVSGTITHRGDKTAFLASMFFTLSHTVTHSLLHSFTQAHTHTHTAAAPR